MSQELLSHSLAGDQKSFGRHGRPLSIIESTHETSSDEAHGSLSREDKNAKAMHLNSSSLPSSEMDIQTSATSVDEDELERQVATVFARSVEGEMDTQTSQTIKIKDLSRLIQDVEKTTGSSILDAQMLDQVEAFANSNPELAVQPEAVVAMIRQLYAAREGEEKAVEQTMSQKGMTNVHSSSRDAVTDSDTSSFGTSDSEEELRESRDTVMHSPSSSSQNASKVSFPRSASERADMSSHADDMSSEFQQRKVTTSDPSIPTPTHRRASTPGGEAETISRHRARNSSNADREVLKGRGKAKAPPSSWSRPKPQALANRDRNRRISGSSTASGSFDGEFERTGNGSPSTTSPPSSSMRLRDADTPDRGFPSRQRLSSQPDSVRDFSTSARPLPRSTSSSSQAFVFPRAASPSGLDPYDAETSERWNAFVDEFRAGDPTDDLSANRFDDERSTPGTHDVLSPSLSATEFVTRRSIGSRRSSVASRRRKTNDYGDATLTGEEQVIAMQAQLEGVQRLLAEKNRSIESMQRESEEYISRLQEEVERLKSDLSLRRKEDALNRVRENINLDNIAGLEADLNRTTTELETLRAQHARLRSDHDDLVVAMERHTARAYEYREEIEKAKAQAEEAAELEKQWEADRESYRETIKKLNAELASVQQSLLGRDEDGRMIASLQANIDSLNIELEEARNRGSNVNPSRVASEAGGTLSKRLGAELAKSFVQPVETTQEDEEDVQDEEDEIIDRDTETESYDRSTDSVIIIRRRKRRSQAGPSRSIDLTDRATQTQEDAKAEGSEDAAPPPTYDDVRSEEEIIKRVHPSLSTSSTLLSEVKLRPGKITEHYRDMAHALQFRCIQMEEHIQKSRIDLATSATTATETISAPATPTSGPVYQSGLAKVKYDFLRRELWVVAFVFGCLTGILLIKALVGDVETHDESADLWRKSNTLQVPWSGAASLALQQSEHSGLLQRLFGVGTQYEAVRVPT